MIIQIHQMHLIHHNLVICMHYILLAVYYKNHQVVVVPDYETLENPHNITSSDIFSVHYYDNTIYFFKNGVELSSETVSSNLTFYEKLILYLY